MSTKEVCNSMAMFFTLLESLTAHRLVLLLLEGSFRCFQRAHLHWLLNTDNLQTLTPSQHALQASNLTVHGIRLETGQCALHEQ